MSDDEGKTLEFDKLVISPTNWSGKKLKVYPGDLSGFLPTGDRSYGYQNNSFEPIKGAPPQNANGGFVYFDNSLRKEDFEGFLRMIGVKVDSKDYGAFVKESENPLEDRYFKQMRLVSRFGLRFMFDAINERQYETFEEQKLSVQEALWAFMDSEAHKYGTSFGDPRIEGKIGGDGDLAREKLSFGFMLENDYYKICRIWSRAWLVTK